MPKLYDNSCLNCGKKYKGSSPKFCSRECYSEYAWTNVECHYCRKTFRTRKQYLQRGQMKYCSPECSSLASIKREVKEFNGKNYYLNFVTGYFENPDGTKLHREVWSFYNGQIPTGCVIHHKDEDKTNNDIGNLELMEWGEHSSLHNQTSPKTPKKPKKKCSANGCERDSKAKGLCTMHYQRLKKEERGHWL